MKIHNNLKKDNRKSILYIFLIVLFLSILSIGSYLLISNFITNSSPEEIRVLKKTIGEDTNFTYPQITGMKDTALQSKINKSLKNKIFTAKITEFKGNKNSLGPDTLRTIKKYYSFIKFKVYYNKNNLLSIVTYSEYLSYRPIPEIEPYNIDLENGNFINITDVFEKDALKKIDGIVKQKLKGEYKEEIKECSYTLEDAIRDTEVRDNTEFYIKKDKLVIIVPLSGAISCPLEVEIPWEEVKDLTNSSSALKNRLP